MKTVLITGASSGIGLQLCKDYIKKGDFVYACARTQEAILKLEKESPNNLKAIKIDVTNLDQCFDSLEAIKGIDLAILNAGVCEYVNVDIFSSHIFQRVFDVNFMGVVHMTEALLDKLGRGSQLSIVGSLATCLPFTRSQAYGSSKAAVEYYAKSLAVDLKDRGILVQLIRPGFVKTPLTDKNDFNMPLVIPVEEASIRIIKGINSKKFSIDFPRGLSWPLSLLSKMSSSWQVKLAYYLRSKA